MIEARTGIKAGDVFAARRELPEAEAEWSMFIEWRVRQREGATQLDYSEWLDSIPAYEVPDIVQAVNGGLEVNPEALASST